MVYGYQIIKVFIARTCSIAPYIVSFHSIDSATLFIYKEPILSRLSFTIKFCLTTIPIFLHLRPFDISYLLLTFITRNQIHQGIYSRTTVMRSELCKPLYHSFCAALPQATIFSSKLHAKTYEEKLQWHKKTLKKTRNETAKYSSKG